MPKYENNPFIFTTVQYNTNDGRKVCELVPANEKHIRPEGMPRFMTTAVIPIGDGPNGPIAAKRDLPIDTDTIEEAMAMCMDVVNGAAETIRREAVQKIQGQQKKLVVPTPGMKFPLNGRLNG